MNSWIVTWEDAAGNQRRNQVNAPDRDSAIWRLALLMQCPPDKLGTFVSCEPETQTGAGSMSYPNPAYSVTGSSADEYKCISAGLTEDAARELARQESATGRWGTVLVKLDATGITVATYRHGEPA